MSITTEQWRTDLIYSGENGYDNPQSPMWFGAEGKDPQKTYITDEPLKVSQSDYRALVSLVKAVVPYINSYSLEGKAEILGADPKYVEDSLTMDGDLHFGRIVYGGMDAYIDPEEGALALEINARVQAMGLQDTRLHYLNINDQPLMVDHFIRRLKSEGLERIMLLGNKLNPFWRSHARLSRWMSLAGIECVHDGAERLAEIWEEGFRPDAFIKLSSSEFLLTHPSAAFLREKVGAGNIPFINPVSSTFYGDRGFMEQVAKDLPHIFPPQREITYQSDEDEVMAFPWLKLEAGREFAYVVNFQELRRWGKDAVMALIKRNFPSVEDILSDKESADAQNMREAGAFLSRVPEEQIKWVAQKPVKPLITKLNYQGNLTDINVLHRVYWVSQADGKVDVSIEGFGCTPDQFSRSKGKINAGSGIAIPVVIT